MAYLYRKEWSCHTESSQSPSAPLRPTASPHVRVSPSAFGPASDAPSWTVSLRTAPSPRGSDQLALRAYQLRSPAERTRIANALVGGRGEACRGTPMNLRVRPQRDAVRAAADELQWLVLRLRDEHPTGLAGVAKAARLVDDRSGPLYRHDAGDLDQAIASARAALEPTRRVVSEPTAWAA